MQWHHKQDTVSQEGFTLVEILVAGTILMSLAAGLLLTLNPFRQVGKAQDAQKVSNLNQIKQALELYYEDNKCYPTDTSVFTDVLETGGRWEENGAVYMQEVPQDSDGSYRYITDDSTCPQWNALFVELAQAPDVSACPLSSLATTCVPQDYSSSYACVISGAVNCQLLASGNFEDIDGNLLPTPTPVPSSTPTPTPTPPPGGVTFNVGMNQNPQFTGGYIAPYDAIEGQARYLSVNIRDNQAPITSVRATIRDDSTTTTYTFSRISGTDQNGTWAGAWTSGPTTTIDHIDVTATDTASNSSVLELRL